MKKYYNSPAADLVRVNSDDIMTLSGDQTVGIGANIYDNVLDVTTWGMWTE